MTVYTRIPSKSLQNLQRREFVVLMLFRIGKDLQKTTSSILNKTWKTSQTTHCQIDGKPDISVTLISDSPYKGYLS